MANENDLREPIYGVAEEKTQVEVKDTTIRSTDCKRLFHQRLVYRYNCMMATSLAPELFGAWGVTPNIIALLGKLYNVQTRLSIVCYTGLAIVAILLMASVEGKGMDAVFYILFVLQLVHTTIELIYAITISIPVSLFWDCVLVIPSEETGRFTNAFLTFTASKTRQLVLTDLQTRLLGARQEVGFKFSVMLYRSEWYRNNVSYTCLLSVFALTYYVVCMALGEPTSGPFYARMAFIYLLVGIAAIIVLWCAGAIVYCVLGLLDKLLLCGRVSKYLTQRKMNYINKLLEAQDLDALVRPGMVVWNKNESLFG